MLCYLQLIGIPLNLLIIVISLLYQSCKIPPAPAPINQIKQQAKPTPALSLPVRQNPPQTSSPAPSAGGFHRL